MLATITALLAMASGATCPGTDPAITKVTTSQAAGGDVNAYPFHGRLARTRQA